MSENNILIIEDDERIAQNISKGLQEKGYNTEIAYDGKIGLKMALNSTFDLILLDLNLPQMNGYQVCSEIRKRNANIPIIMLTALGETEDKIDGFDQGADDYIVKPFDFRELLARINVFLKRRSSENDDNRNVLQVDDLVMNLDTKIITRNDVIIELTPKEFSLLEYLVRNQNRVVSKDEIAEKIWESNNNKSYNVIEVYINFLRKKIDKDFETKLIHTKTGMGYILRVN
ncbi:MAG: two-component system copper resistance phosphate regulon response regulator CusR [Spirosomataceae bacterium]|jgi:DNA-binding response OmpR family regulator